MAAAELGIDAARIGPPSALCILLRPSVNHLESSFATERAKWHCRELWVKGFALGAYHFATQRRPRAAKLSETHP